MTPNPPDLDETIANGDTDELTAEANAARAKLLRTVEAIDHKAHDVTNVQLQVRRHMKEIVAAAVIAGTLLVGGVALVAYRIATRDRRRRHERFRMFERVWRHPERTARGDATTFFGRLGRTIALSILTTAVGAPLRRAIMQLLPTAEPAPRAVRDEEAVLRPRVG